MYRSAFQVFHYPEPNVEAPSNYLRERSCGGFIVQFYIHLGYPIPSGSGILVLISKSKPILIFVEVLIYKLTFVNCCGFQTDLRLLNTISG